MTGEAIIGANYFKDIFAGLRDIVGGRSASYEKVLREAKARGADAVIAIDLDYETIGNSGSMPMVSASGMAVKLS